MGVLEDCNCPYAKGDVEQKQRRLLRKGKGRKQRGNITRQRKLCWKEAENASPGISIVLAVQITAIGVAEEVGIDIDPRLCGGRGNGSWGEDCSCRMWTAPGYRDSA